MLAPPVLGREPLEHRVGVRRVTNLERAATDEIAEAVEDDDPARAANRDVTRERVAQLARVGEPTGVEQVVAVEEIEVSHAAVALRRGAAPRRPTR